MSLFSFQFLQDLSSSRQEEDESRNWENVNGSPSSAQSNSSYESVSEMLSGIRTEPTVGETVLVDAPSVMTTDTPEYGDLGAIAGLPAGTFVEIYREHVTQSMASSNAPRLENQVELSRDDLSFLSNLSHSQSSRDYDDEDQEEEEEEERALTIVSSAASGVIVETPPRMEPLWQSAPESRPIYSSHLSISTTESMYRDLASLQNHHEDQPSILEGAQVDSSCLSLPEPSSTGDSCTIAVLSSQPDVIQQSIQTPYSSNSSLDRNNPSSCYDADEYNALSEQDPDNPLGESGDPVLVVEVDRRDCEWFAFFTEQDWGVFRQDAAMILAAIQEQENHGSHSNDEMPFPPLPPMPPNLGENLIPPPRGTYCAAVVLPPTCICSLCKDVIVGATILDCGCVQSAVCLACWKNIPQDPNMSVNNTNVNYDEELESLAPLDLTRPRSSCPSCHKRVSRVVTCHALDAAILHCVEGLPNQHPVQCAYYYRLAWWGAMVHQRNVESQIAAFNANQQRKQLEDEEERQRILAELIAEEEHYFWNEKQRKASNPFVGVAALAGFAVLAAASALTGGGRPGVMRGTLITRR